MTKVMIIGDPQSLSASDLNSMTLDQLNALMEKMEDPDFSLHGDNLPKCTFRIDFPTAQASRRNSENNVIDMLLRLSMEATHTTPSRLSTNVSAFFDHRSPSKKAQRRAKAKAKQRLKDKGERR